MKNVKPASAVNNADLACAAWEERILAAPYGVRDAHWVARNLAELVVRFLIGVEGGIWTAILGLNKL